MSTRIGLIGDPHATPEPLAEALAIFRKEKADAIWCTGDITGYGTDIDTTVMLLKDSGCRTIYGNHEQWYIEKASHQAASPTNDYINSLPPFVQDEREGKHLYMVHGSPPQSVMKGIRLLDEDGNIIKEEEQAWTEHLSKFTYDVLIIGHTHQVFAAQLGDTLVINPGSTRFNHCCALLSLPDRTIEWFSLSGRMIHYTWNWAEENNKSSE
ncbi:MAG: metallophosphoesterase family protein [Nitrospiraceae bacterium]|nr:MAG: metallophosphoesterase family protein [Nitrospiraceae bacterium]